MSINKVVITGNLTREPELKRTASGMAILNLGIAVNDRRKDPKSGEWGDYANFIDCVMFGTRAESISNYLHKGIKVAIDGKLRWSQWESEGQKRSKVEVTVDDIEILTPKGEQSNSPQAHAPIEVSAELYDDSIPF